MATIIKVEEQDKTDTDDPLIGLPEEDPFENDTIIVFECNYGNQHKNYLYAALKAKDRWYLTGAISTSTSWATLRKQYLKKAEVAYKVEEMSEIFQVE